MFGFIPLSLFIPVYRILTRRRRKLYKENKNSMRRHDRRIHVLKKRQECAEMSTQKVKGAAKMGRLGPRGEDTRNIHSISTDALERASEHQGSQARNKKEEYEPLRSSNAYSVRCRFPSRSPSPSPAAGVCSVASSLFRFVPTVASFVETSGLLAAEG